MAKVTNLVILNPADKTRMFTVASGKGAPTDADDPINADVRTYPIGSQYTDVENKNFYVRMGAEGTSADWKQINANDLV